MVDDLKEYEARLDAMSEEELIEEYKQSQAWMKKYDAWRRKQDLRSIAWLFGAGMLDDDQLQSFFNDVKLVSFYKWYLNDVENNEMQGV